MSGALSVAPCILIWLPPRPLGVFIRRLFEVLSGIRAGTCGQDEANVSITTILWVAHMFAGVGTAHQGNPPGIKRQPG
jgi:hypothetical protein